MKTLGWLLLPLVVTLCVKVRAQSTVPELAAIAEDYQESLDGWAARVERFYGDSATPEFTAELKIQNGSQWIEYRYAGEPTSIEVVRPDAYFLLTLQGDEWIPRKANRSGPTHLTALPELYAPAGIQGILFAADGEGPFLISSQGDGQFTWSSRASTNSHGSFSLGEDGLIEQATSIRDQVGSVATRLIYDTSSSHILELHSQGQAAKNPTAEKPDKTTFVWRPLDADESIFTLAYYGLSEDLLGPSPQPRSPSIPWTLILVLVGGLALAAAAVQYWRDSKQAKS